jgi:hypothetical protein
MSMKCQFNLGAFTLAAFTFVVTITLGPSIASALTAVQPAPGLACMSLDSQALQTMQQSDLPPVLAAPNPSAARLGYPSAIVFVKWPLVQQSGYTEMERLNGQTGWIATDHLTTWHPLNGGNAKCVPSIMSNGQLGTSIH